MSTGGHSRQASSRSSVSTRSIATRPIPPPISLTPENEDPRFEPCAATASFLLYAQRNVILVLHHDTLAIERRFDLHREDVIWIAVDNTSERGSGRLAVSYDNGNTAIVWDILTGGEIARFSAYERMKIASFMRNGNIAFGNDQGNVILFEPSTSEHLSARTIFDPITALAPSADCRIFAIGYSNGSVLIATLQPSFTILHTLTTQRQPSRIMGLAWHGSSSKQKTDMLATQTLDGDLRVWSIPKIPHTDSPNIIRVLQRSEMPASGPCWFAWSKNGRIVQHVEGETRAWDVRTKKVTYEIIPTVDGVMGISIYGPSATLFTLGRANTVQQYDINPSNTPIQVSSVQHVPANTPPTPPTLLDDSEYKHTAASGPSRLPLYAEVESSADEGSMLSPLQKIAKEMDSLDALESELRDKVMPLSPTSSRASSSSSRSSGHGRRGRKYLYDRPSSSRASSSTGYEGTEFSFGGTASLHHGRDNMSVRSSSTFQSRRHPPSHLRKEVSRGADQSKTTGLDLFPFTKARLRDVPFRTPHYGNGTRTPELLQREMLSVIFGWNDTIRMLVRDELNRHRSGTPAAVLLSKWVGGMGADDMAAMIGSETMTSADWMLLALSSIGSDSQKKVGEAFVQRLLEKGDIHPAVAILLSLKEPNEAIEVYVSQKYWMEAVILTCLECPSDWQRQSFLVRKWGEHAVQQGQAELAVRCFSCTSVETSEPWFSPRAQDAAYTAQQERLTGPLSGGATSPPISPPARSASGRLTAKNASLKLITNFGSTGSSFAPRTAEITPMVVGATPIAESALSPGGDMPWRRETTTRMMRDPTSAMTATPGGYARRKRLPSRSDIERAKQEAAELSTPITAARDYAASNKSTHSRRTSNAGSLHEPMTSLRPTVYNANANENRLPSPTQGVFPRLSSLSKDGKLDMKAESIGGVLSPPLTGNSLKARAIDDYISSVDEARNVARRERNESRRRADSQRSLGAGALLIDNSYVPSGKRSPSSPIPMSPAEVAQAGATNILTAIEPATTDDENFYKRISAGESESSLKFSRFDKPLSTRERASSRARSRAAKEGSSDEDKRKNRGRSESRKREAAIRNSGEAEETKGDGSLRTRARSSSRKPQEDGNSRRATSRGTRERSSSRRPKPTDTSSSFGYNGSVTASELSNLDDPQLRPRLHGLSRKELAAKELEERRLSLARRPSAPSIPLPGELPFNIGRPQMSPRSQTEPNNTIIPPSRSQTVDPDAMTRYNRANNGGLTLPQIGLPATPRAMRHPRYMNSETNEGESIPPVPDLPTNPSELSSIGSSVTGSYVSYMTGTTHSVLSSTMQQAYPQISEVDDIGPLLPSTVFGQKGPQAPTRAASAPPEKFMQSHHPYKPIVPPSNPRLSSTSRGLIRKISPPEAPAGNITSIDQALHEQQVVIIPDDTQPTILPELQHLAGPPPPPPPPASFHQGVINIAIGDSTSSPTEVIDVPVQSLPLPIERSATADGTNHRRGRGSVSESFGTRFRGVAGRMRSTSRNNSPTVKDPQHTSPYETVLPPIPMPSHRRHESMSRAKSPYEQAVAAGQIDGISVQIPPPPPPPPAPRGYGLESRIVETTVPPNINRPPSRSQSAMGGYRNPKEIRANMPPGSLQQGVYTGQAGFL